MSAQAHEEMVAAVAPYVDSAISKTVNVPAFVPGLAHGQQRQQTWPDGCDFCTACGHIGTCG